MPDVSTDARFETIRWYLDRRDDAAGWVALQSVEAELAFDHRARLELEAELQQVKAELDLKTQEASILRQMRDKAYDDMREAAAALEGTDQ